MSEYFDMTLAELQKEHAELLAFNEDLDRRLRAQARLTYKYKSKCLQIAALFVVPSEEKDMTLRAIKNILERVGEA